MILHIFTVHDSKAEAYLPPFFMRSIGEAQRAFADAVNSPEKGNFSDHYADYTLFVIGEYDDQNAVIVNLEPKKALANGVQVKIESE